MHSAPAVSYPIGRSRFHGGLLGSASLTGILAGLLWRQQADPALWQQCLFALIVLGAGLAAVIDWWTSPDGTLQWDGQGWSLVLPLATPVGPLSAHLDLQSCLLLCLRAENGRRNWVWIERWRDPASWNALRRAVFAGSAAGPAQHSGVDDPALRVKS
ncbi:MAG: hypothetical protein ACOYNZ_03925 [Rhodoferax sp.]